MIVVTKNETAIATFSKDEFGTIAVVVEKNVLSLRAFDSPKVIGQIIDSSDDLEISPKINLEFHKEESIEVMIKALEKIRFNIRHPHGCLALAC